MLARRSRWPGWLLATGAMTLLLSALLLFAPSDAAAEKDPYLPYGGVSLQGGDPPSPKEPPPGFQHINWPGFRSDAKTGAAEVFLQLTGPVQYTVKTRGRRVHVVLKQVQVYLKNNFRTVLALHFPKQPVARFKLRQLKGAKVRLEIRLRRRAKPSVALRTIGKYTYLVVSFAGR